MRSKLFVPAIRPELFEKSLQYGADGVCFDLEDAVALGRKSAAREYLESFLSQQAAGQTVLIVRTNPVMSLDFRFDLSAAIWPSVSAIALPKVESAEEIHLAVERIAALESERGIKAPLGIFPTIESPLGLRLASEIARASKRIIGLQAGFADLLEPLGISPGNTSARNHIRLMLRLAAAEANVDCYDSAFPAFRNPAAYQQHLEAGRALGFAGASCIHPSQIAATNLTYTPTSEALAYAAEVVAAAREAAQRGTSVINLHGKMIDRPYVLAAERVLARRPAPSPDNPAPAESLQAEEIQ